MLRMKGLLTSSKISVFNWMLLVLFAFQFSHSSKAQGTIPSIGVDFWYGYMHNSATSNEELRLFITSQVSTSGTVAIPLQGWSVNFTVAPNLTTTIIIPNSVGETTGSDVVETKGIHVTTLDSVSLFAINFATYSADASKILPKKSLGTDYLVTAYRGLAAQSRSEFLIVATEINTQISITPSVLTEGNQPAGIPFIIDLDAGETYQIRSQSIVGDLTGTRITSTPQSGECRPFAVFAGAQCTNVPTTCSTCDHLYDQLFPVETWGTEYYVVPYQTTGVYTYRVIARDNGTQVSINGAAPISMVSGQVLEFNNVSTPTQVVGTSPIQVVQYMQGDACSLNGDPAMLVLNANDQKIDNVTFSTVASAVITSHFMNIIVETADVGNVLLDNAPIPAGNFNMFSTNPLNSYAQIPLSSGSHNVQAANGLTAYIYGMGTAESYTYSVGSFKQEPLFVVDTTICTTDSVVLTSPAALFSYEWVALSDTSTILGTAPNLVMFPPIPTDIYTVTGNSLVSGCPVTYNYSISAPASPVITLTASEDTVCVFNSVQMNVNVLTSGTWQYAWSPAYMFNDPTLPNPILTVQQSGWYSVAVSNVGVNCSIAEDSVYIVVEGGGIESVTVSASSDALCLPENASLTGVINQILVSEDFDGGLTSSLWSSISGHTLSSTCGSVSGGSLLFNGGPVRSAQTNNFNLANGGNLSFYIKVATGTAPCDDAEIGEDIFLEYSTNNGASWVLMATLLESNYPTFTYLSLPIPTGAQTGATRFRWRQPTFSGTNQDVWMLENIGLSATNSVGVSYTWTPSSTLSSATSLTPTASPTVPTWYMLEVGQGVCSYSDSVFIDVNEEFTLSTTNDTTVCSNQALTLITTPSAGSGYSYFWEPASVISSSNQNDSIFIGTVVDTMMYVTVSSPLGCVQTDSVQISAVEMDFEILGDSILCIAESTTLQVSILNSTSSNYSIEWIAAGTVIGTTNSLVVSPTSTTLYTVQITDLISQCQWIETKLVQVINFAVNAGPDATLCSTLGYQMQGSSTISTLNPVISWSNAFVVSPANAYNGQILANLSGQFVLSVSDGNCTYTDTMNLTYSPPIEVNIPSDTTICIGDSFVLDFTGTSSVVWNTTNGIQFPQSNQPIVSPTSTQTYSINYTTSNGCPASAAMIVNVNPLPVVSLPADIVKCMEDTQVISSSVNTPNGAYLWNTAQTTPSIQVQNQGVYSVTYSTICGSDSDSIEITFHPDFTIDLGNDSLLCSGYLVDLNPIIPPGGAISWSTGQTSPTITVSSPSTTSVSVFDVFGCVRQDTIVLTALPEIVIDLGPDFSMCEYDTSTLNGTSPQGVTYLWNTGQTTPTISVSDAGTYSVQVSDVLGCLNWDTVVVTETPTPTPMITGPSEFCSNESVQFEASSGFVNYQWSTGATTNPMQFQGITNQLWVLVTDSYGCVGGDTLAVSVIDVPLLDLGTDIVLCDTHVVVLNAQINGASGYLWTPTNETSPTIDALPGNYSVLVNYQICTISDAISITVEPYEFALGEDRTLCFEDGIFLAHSLYNIDSIIWQDGRNSSWYEQLNYSSLDDSVLISATAYGCDVKFDTVLIILEDCNCQVYVPNSFTPNGDQINEDFRVYHECPVVEFEFLIFDRWGELIFQSVDPDFAWTGQLDSGEMVQDGTYFWKMRYANEYTREIRVKEFSGHVNVLK